MEENKVKCIRCKGRKKMYKVQGAYSHTNTGGKEVDCPMCMGEGFMEKMPGSQKEIKKIKGAKKFIQEKQKDLSNEED